ncbi:unnamed protein product [Paramecium octaurelia]|uniref:HSF-type DNA-binding domain-containing protein n=1 Tax=Paramecium octaurelia TaxID=43137 RepID=A0A8S1U0A6_PAROT|nr:unnamed protein product [Paramecium octaurelia]
MQQKKSPKFLVKLYELLDSEQYRYLRWSEDGRSFQVCDLKKLERQVLKVFYKQKSFASFIRQLNLYGFKRSKIRRNVNVFSHRHFIRGDKDQLINIISHNKLRVLEELSNQDNNLKPQIYEAEHQQLTETLKDLQNQQKQIQIKFNEQIHLQTQLKLRILQIMNQINNHDISINVKAQNSYQLLCKVMQIIPNNEQHKEELAVIKYICKVFNEFHKDSVSSLFESPNERLTPLPFYLQDSAVIPNQLDTKVQKNKLSDQFQIHATKIFQPSQVKQQQYLL